ncbi:hypothetical protein NIES2135_28900 [Leptolyngbya boryana NIES-2135]|jgi:hypothetical protein|uniref:Uncharacterized protein n=1 Tax=Leptolyngbya boryana NIES-2135 TaxID=1973484 RepID=A0A1Z4JH16_LEPBY|nr:hypothetical protein LBWT_37030 [Leptolyngbya boryana IAM M-101]BAS64089.1 hypothetical protein LBDG_37030 [Leptolyngbya boryana dg5]BAY56062.1 hypothetical protein NIES2135_28900 [Leptolyngbya boryana NIES-2135]
MSILGVSWLRFLLAIVLIGILCYVLRDDHKNLIEVLIPTITQLLLIDLSFRKELKEKQLQFNEVEDLLKKLIVGLKSEDSPLKNSRTFPNSQIQEVLPNSQSKTYIRDAYDNLLSQGFISKGLHKHLVNRLSSRSKSR